ASGRANCRGQRVEDCTDERPHRHFRRAYFADYVQNQLSDVITGEGADHLRIYTTIDMDLQRAAYSAVTNQLAALDKIEAKRVPEGTVQASLVAMNAQTGEIVA